MNLAITARAIGIAVSGAALVVATAGAASAGEITGNGKWINNDQPHGNSICAYSGQNDAYHYPSYADFPGDELDRVQSYGELVSSGVTVPAFEQPGSACNGHSGFLAGAGGE